MTARGVSALADVLLYAGCQKIIQLIFCKLFFRGRIRRAARVEARRHVKKKNRKKNARQRASYSSHWHFIICSLRENDSTLPIV